MVVKRDKNIFFLKILVVFFVVFFLVLLIVLIVVVIKDKSEEVVKNGVILNGIYFCLENLLLEFILVCFVDFFNDLFKDEIIVVWDFVFS